MIKCTKVYCTKGKEFNTFRKAVEYRESLIEEFLRKLPGFNDVPLSQRTHFVETVIRNRQQLIDLLTYSDQDDSDDD